MWRWLLLLLLWLSGCASPPVVQAPIAAQATFVLTGRIAVQHGERRQTAGLRWTHRLQSDTVDLLTPLGGTAARIYRDSEHATLQREQQVQEADNLEALMQQVLGWYLPLAGLNHWVLARPMPGRPVEMTRNASGQLDTLLQDGWRIRYSRYSDTQPQTLPTRMQLEYEDLRVTLLLDEWEWNSVE